jgi:two-component system cell cycle response regulator
MQIPDIPDQKKMVSTGRSARTRIEQPVSIDLLTGVFSRQFLLDMAAGRFSEARRRGYTASVVVVEIDAFDDLVRTEGSAIGDEVLIDVADLLRTCVRREDVVARFGDGQFVVLMMHCDLDNAENKAESLRRAIEDSEPGGLPVTASFGVASAPVTAGVEFADLFDAADGALFLAREQAGNVVAVGELPAGRREDLAMAASN